MGKLKTKRLTVTCQVGLELTSQFLLPGADTETPGPLRMVSVLYQILHDCRPKCQGLRNSLRSRFSEVPLVKHQVSYTGETS